MKAAINIAITILAWLTGAYVNEMLVAVNWAGRTVVTEGTLVLGFVGVLITTATLVWRKVVTPAVGAVKSVMHKFEDLNEIINRELADDGNGSTKSKINKIQESQERARVERLQVAVRIAEVENRAHRERQQIQATLDSHVSDLELHNRSHHHEES